MPKKTIVRKKRNEKGNVDRMIFVNFSNHASCNWSQEQLCEAGKYGEIIDLPFPSVPAEMEEEGIACLADKCVEKIMASSQGTAPAAVMCQGEFTLAFAVTKRLRKMNIPVVAACSERIAEVKDGAKISVFRFRRFRCYE